jgi:hypothetical protein
MPRYRHIVLALLRGWILFRKLKLLRGWMLYRKLRGNPAFELLGVVLLDRRTRRAATRLLFELGRNPRLRRVIVRRLPSR